MLRRDKEESPVNHPGSPLLLKLSRPRAGIAYRSETPGSRSLNVSGDDLSLEVLELVDDVVDVATGGCVADTIIRQVEGVEAAFGSSVLDILAISSTAVSTRFSIEVKRCAFCSSVSKFCIRRYQRRLPACLHQLQQRPRSFRDRSHQRRCTRRLRRRDTMLRQFL